MFPYLDLKLSTFVCPDFFCPVCSYSGDVELKTIQAGKPSETYSLGSRVGDGLAGRLEVHDALFCPSCAQKKNFKLHGVTLVIQNGVFVSAYF